MTQHVTIRHGRRDTAECEAQQDMAELATGNNTPHDMTMC